MEIRKINKVLLFPKGFLWGASTASHQVEGGNFNNDWWEFEQKGKIKDGSSAKIACDHYHLFEKDFSLAQKLGHNAHRLSLEWSRIQPQPHVWDEQETEHYRQVLLSLKKHKLTSFVTLHHFTNPLWFAKIGGWENPKSPEIFARYVKFCVQNFSDLVDFWLTINEPQVVAEGGFIRGYFPPEKHNVFPAVKVAKNLMKAHRLAYQEIHKIKPKAKVSFTTLQNLFEPARGWFLPEILATKIADYLQNHWFLHQAKNYLDFIGLDYYHYTKLRFNSTSFNTFFFDLAQEGAEKSDFGWVIYPKGIYKVLLDLKKYKLPIYIMENGVADRDDHLRPSFILRCLRWVHRAIQEGADVRSYLHWTLMDNFEWAQGLSMRFGLCQTNYETLKRTPRKSAKMYKEIILANGITEKIVKKYEPELLREIFV
ncbi:MAG: glycoside hydrolase family 1 protein [Patescibacteria group bacterium]